MSRRTDARILPQQPLPAATAVQLASCQTFTRALAAQLRSQHAQQSQPAVAGGTSAALSQHVHGARLLEALEAGSAAAVRLSPALARRRLAVGTAGGRRLARTGGVELLHGLQAAVVAARAATADRRKNTGEI